VSRRGTVACAGASAQNRHKRTQAKRAEWCRGGMRGVNRNRAAIQMKPARSIRCAARVIWQQARYGVQQWHGKREATEDPQNGASAQSRAQSRPCASSICRRGCGACVNPRRVAGDPYGVCASRKTRKRCCAVRVKKKKRQAVKRTKRDPKRRVFMAYENRENHERGRKQANKVIKRVFMNLAVEVRSRMNAAGPANPARGVERVRQPTAQKRREGKAEGIKRTREPRARA